MSAMVALLWTILFWASGMSIMGDSFEGNLMVSIAILVGCILGLSYFIISYSLDKLFKSTLSFDPPLNLS